MINFELAVCGTGMLSKLAVRFNGLSMDGESIDEIGYHIEWFHLLRWNNAAYSADYDGWVGSPIPSPLVFEPASNEGLTRQKGVTVRPR